MNEAREFALYAFGVVAPMVEALVEDARCALGPEFRENDIRWHETTRNGNNEQVCSLMWKETELLRLQLSLPKAKMECSVTWYRTPH